jgi:hypothetical protein
MPRVLTGPPRKGMTVIREENLPALLFMHQFWHARALVQLGKVEQGTEEMLRIEEFIARFAATPFGSAAYPAIAENYSPRANAMKGRTLSLAVSRFWRLPRHVSLKRNCEDSMASFCCSLDETRATLKRVSAGR